MKNLIEQKYERLTAIRKVGKNRFGCYLWECLCECGNTVIISSGNWGRTRSCGCLVVEQAKRMGDSQRVNPRLKHGHARKGAFTREYRAYYSAKVRCTDPTRHNYAAYGGRGIEFLFTSFKQFIAEIGPRPSRKHSLDRTNNNGNYEPGNVRWATAKEQAENKCRKCGGLFSGHMTLKLYKEMLHHAGTI
jgi:hypothetical protein